MKKTWTQFIFLALIAFVILPVSGYTQNGTNDIQNASITNLTQNVTITTAVPTTAVMITESQITTPMPNPANASGIIGPNVTTLLPEPGVTTVLPVMTPVAQDTKATTFGNVTVASSPMGASILIDGVFYGTTPGNITGISTGNHIIRLTLSGYYDYEGTLYVVPDQPANEFGTLPPIAYIQPTAVPVTPATVPVAPTPTPASSGPLENPTVLAAIIGVVTATVGAGATIFSHIMKAKKE